jgi:hypothetical protein
MGTREGGMNDQEIRETFAYDPESGVVTRLRKTLRTKVGQAVGSKTKNGYILVSFHDSHIYAHRLAWFLVTGAWPPNDIDHINGNRSDNRFSNLRAATRSQNLAAKRPLGRHPKGVSMHPDPRRTKRYSASITKDGVRRFIGWFYTPVEAGEAYHAAAVQEHGEFACAV